jgi:hypothetical protein
MEKVLEWLGQVLNNQKISGVDYNNPEQKEAIRLLRECNVIDRLEGDVFALHPHFKERFARADKILSIHEKLAVIKEEFKKSPFAASPAQSELLKIINQV